MTPIIPLNLIDYPNKIYIKRDDLLPFAFGGNKVRIAQEFISDMKKQEKNCIIGYGSTRSNLSRALANICASERIPCYIISPTDDDGTRVETSNSMLVKKCGAIVYECSKTNVAETVDEVMDVCHEAGLKPYYIYGNRLGNGNEIVPMNAYRKVYAEIAKQSKEMGINYDYIFLATGTGMTQSGLLIGKSINHGSENIVGISIARNAEMETELIQKKIQTYISVCGVIPKFDCEVIVDDSYLCGGYGISNEKIDDFIMKIYSNYGIPLDPTYTGKALYGSLDYLQKNRIKDKNVLFIHTGGTPLFFDYLLKVQND